MSIVLLISVFYVSFFAIYDTEAAENVIIVDAGHGGIDPGKVGVDSSVEKDLNLEIAIKLANELENDGYKVLLTRTEDNGLYDASDTNKKASDLQKRCQIAEKYHANLMISIHQNSFPDSRVKGAQVFYYKHSTEGKKLANRIQEAIKTEVDNKNTRSAKYNDNYYLLLHTSCPTVIVECGFMSNKDELQLLKSDEYQTQLCHAITKAVNDYFN